MRRKFGWGGDTIDSLVNVTRVGDTKLHRHLAKISNMFDLNYKYVVNCFLIFKYAIPLHFETNR